MSDWLVIVASVVVTLTLVDGRRNSTTYWRTKRYLLLRKLRPADKALNQSLWIWLWEIEMKRALFAVCLFETSSLFLTYLVSELVEQTLKLLFEQKENHWRRLPTSFVGFVVAVFVKVPILYITRHLLPLLRLAFMLPISNKYHLSLSPSLLYLPFRVQMCLLCGICTSFSW